MNLIINQNVLKTLKGAGFYPDTMLTALTALFALQEGEIDLLDELDDKNISQRAILVYYDLVRKGLWEETPEGDQFFKPTESGIMLYEELRHLMSAPTHSEEVIKPKKVNVSFDTFFDTWFNLWPKGVKTMGKLIRSDEKGCKKKMQAFVKDYPQYSYKQIIDATHLYLYEREQEGWKGVRCATYFIHHKDSGSDLASWCDQSSDLETNLPNSNLPNGNFFI